MTTLQLTPAKFRHLAMDIVLRTIADEPFFRDHASTRPIFESWVRAAGMDFDLAFEMTPTEAQEAYDAYHQYEGEAR